MGDWFSGIMSGISNFFGGGDSGGGSDSGSFDFGTRGNTQLSPDVLSAAAGAGAGAYGSAGEGGNIPANENAPSPGGDVVGSRGGDWWSSIKGGVSDLFGSPKDALSTLGKVGQLGATGMGIAGGIAAQKQAAEQVALQKKAQQQLTAAAAPAIASGGTLTTAGATALEGGQLPPQLEAQVLEWRQKQIAQMNDRLSHMGIADSTMQAEMNAWIDEQEKIMRGQLAGQLYQGGLAGIQTGTKPEGDVLVSATGQANRDNASIANASANIFKLLGAS
jgi:hypothetical protein